MGSRGPISCSKFAKIFYVGLKDDSNVEKCNFDHFHTTNKRDDYINVLKYIQRDNKNKLVFAHLNINSIRNKSELLCEEVKSNKLRDICLNDFRDEN